jgi:hemerythrin-like domain-containing protein
MQYTLMLWHADHLNFDRILRLLEAELGRFHEDRDPDYPLMLEIMYYMTHYADALHHRKEDIVFAKMKARDPRLGDSIEDLARQHVRLHEIGEEMSRELDDVVNGSIAPRGRVERAARTYIDGLRAHMRFEEGQILPLASQLLSDDDWSDIDAAIANFDDPIFGSSEEERYARIRQQINEHARHAQDA